MPRLNSALRSDSFTEVTEHDGGVRIAVSGSSSIAHGRMDEIDYKVFDRLQRDVLKLLRENVLR